MPGRFIIYFRESVYIFAALFTILLVSSVSCTTYNTFKRDINGNTPLHEAVLKRDISLVSKLIRKGSDMYALNNQSLSPLQLAASLKEREIVQLLISSGARVNYDPENTKKSPWRKLSFTVLKYPEKRPNFFLTFDAGDDNSNIDYILKTLKKYRITATFFITGRFIMKYPADVKRIVCEGHIAGNHTFTHCRKYKNENHLLNELYETEHLFKKITGREMMRIWRAPYLQHIGKSWMLKSAMKLGYRHIDASLFSKDWLDEGDRGYLSNDKFVNLFADKISFKHISRISLDGMNYSWFRKKVPDYHGVIMLMHVGKFRKNGNDFVFILEDVILQIISRGYFFDDCGKFEQLETF
jgi:peptidoglycan/xylan/chitin deacetylase (PgdA/CDA1 family)